MWDHAFDCIVRTSNHVSTDDFACIRCCGCAGIECCLYGGNVSADDGIAKSAADLLHRADELDVCGFEHRVNADDETGEATGFEESNCLFGHGSYMFGVSVWMWI